MELIFKPLSQTLQVVCIHGKPDLEEYCRYSDIEVCLYPDLAVGQSADEGSAVLPDMLLQGEPSSALLERENLRLSPDSARRRAFLRGWTAGANGTAGSVRGEDGVMEEL